MEKESVHISVLLEECCTFLRAAEGGRFLDCTLGGAGHSKALLDRSAQVSVLACDRDPKALERAERYLAPYKERVQLSHAAFSDLLTVAEPQSFDGILADLGLSTDQLREERGFSFQDETLDMRMDPSSGSSAQDLLNGAAEQELFVVLKKGGVGNEARTITRAILRERPIVSAAQLAELVAKSAPGGRDKKIHPATVVFQALRIAVNRELEEIQALLEAAPQLVKKGGRLAIISFHSLEDTLVARCMRDWEGRNAPPAHWPGAHRPERRGTLLTKKAVVPSEEEIARNPSARSARMRVFEFN